MIVVRHVSSIRDIPIDQPTWDGMVQLNQTNTVFQTYEWFNSWWHVYGDLHELIFLMAFDDSELIGFATLMKDSSACLGSVIRFAGDSNADYCDFVITRERDAVVDAFINYLHSSGITWRQLALINIPDYSDTAATIRSTSRSRKLNLVEKAAVPCPTVLIVDHNDRATSSVNKYSVMRHVKKLNKMGKVSFECLYEKQAIKDHLENFFTQHIQRHKLKHFDSQFKKPRNKRFFYQLVDRFSGTRWLFMAILKLDDTPIAYHVGFDYGNRLLWYKPSFNIKFSRHSPGTVMIRELIAYAIEEARDELDFTIGDEPFKHRFCSLTRHNHNLFLYRTRFMYALSSLRYKVVSYVRKLRG